MEHQEITALNEKLKLASPVAVLKEAFRYYEAIALSFSGAEDVVLVDMASKIVPQLQVFCLDTGRLHPETYKFIEQIRVTYDLQLELLSPNAKAVEELVRRKGLFSFYQDGHQECCSIRKVEPLKRVLGKLDAWITGQRRDQSPTRSTLETVEFDATFSAEGHSLIKFNPLTHWSLTDVWDYIQDNEIPYNPLHDQGYISIGCEPCTRAIRPTEHERAGRWWWEEATLRECGLHKKTTEQT